MLSSPFSFHGAGGIFIEVVFINKNLCFGVCLGGGYLFWRNGVKSFYALKWGKGFRGVFEVGVLFGFLVELGRNKMGCLYLKWFCICRFSVLAWKKCCLMKSKIDNTFFNTLLEMYVKIVKYQLI